MFSSACVARDFNERWIDRILTWIADGLRLRSEPPYNTNKQASQQHQTQHRPANPSTQHPTKMMNLRMQFKRIQIHAATMGIHHIQKPLSAMMMTCGEAEAIEQLHSSRMKVQQCPCQRVDVNVPIIDVLPTLWGFAIHIHLK